MSELSPNEGILSRDFKEHKRTQRDLNAREEAIEGLGRHLFETMNRLDPPVEDEAWERLDQSDRLFYCACIRSLMQEPNLLKLLIP